MSEMRKVEPQKPKFENPTVKKFRLGMRDLINKYSGQESLIAQYYAAIQTIPRHLINLNPQSLKSVPQIYYMPSKVVKW